jgi:hypothetical protein
LIAAREAADDDGIRFVCVDIVTGKVIDRDAQCGGQMKPGEYPLRSERSRAAARRMLEQRLDTEADKGPFEIVNASTWAGGPLRPNQILCSIPRPPKEEDKSVLARENIDNSYQRGAEHKCAPEVK